MARRPQPQYSITPALPADLDAIMEIERLSFPTPWSRQVFAEEFNHDFSRVMVVRQIATGKLLAFINYWLVHDEVHILNVATHPAWRRKGLARKLIEHTIAGASARRARLLTLEVRRSNQAALELYRGFGFREVGVRPRYYENGEDAIVMLLDLP
jgi:ribosomal-protein-alanine N-acetyltransferase